MSGRHRGVGVQTHWGWHSPQPLPTARVFYESPTCVWVDVMAGFGRSPKPEGQRRNPNPVLGGRIRRISATGHALKAPRWPLLKPSKRELELWAALWKTPVSVAWESLGWTAAVARYARLLAVAELPKAPGVVLIEVRQLEDRLGLSPMALLRLRWEIVDDEEAPADQRNVLDVRERLKAVL